MINSRVKRISFNNFNWFIAEHHEGVIQLAQAELLSGNYIRSNTVEHLEDRLATLCERKYAVTTASCTDALFFALSASGIGPGDEVILPAFSYIASVTPIIRCGAIPVFADICHDTLMLDIDSVRKAITPKTKAIIFVQLFGNCIEYEPILELANQKKILLIEDAAQAIGSLYKNKPGGSFGDISCMSFDPTKIISAFATGGILLTDNPDIYHKTLSLSHHGRNEQGKFNTLGYNSKLSSISAGLINLQLDYMEDTLKKYRSIAQRYVSNLKDNVHIEAVIPREDITPTFHKFVVKTKARDLLKKHLTEHNIESKIHYNPLLYEHPLISKYKHIVHSCPVARKTKMQVLSLPIHTGLSMDEINHICDTINKFTKVLHKK